MDASPGFCSKRAFMFEHLFRELAINAAVYFVQHSDAVFWAALQPEAGLRLERIPKNPLRPDSMKLTPEGKRPTLIQAIN